MTDATNPAVLVMGVSGSGKSSVAVRLADQIGATFVEADDYHQEENISAMSRGIPLTDEMRRPWLDALGDSLARKRADGPVVLACSALKFSYRETLRRRGGPLDIVHLTATRSVISERLSQRRGHYMQPGLLDSQLADLEPPGADESPVILDIQSPVDTIARHAADEIRRRHAQLAT